VKSVPRRIAALTACVLAATACGKPIDPNEHVADRGEVTSVTVVCHAEALPELKALERLFDAAGPMLKSRGYTPDEMRETVLSDGGVIVEYRGRTYDSQYMALRLWPRQIQPVYAYAVLPRRAVVFAESIDRQTGKLVFYPWDPNGEAPFVPC
jgi:hypothetical protein